MKTLLNALRWFLGIILALSLFGVIVSGLFIKSTGDLIADENNIKRYLSEGNIYEEFIDHTYEYYQYRTGTTGDTAMLDLFNSEEALSFFKSILSPGWLQIQTDHILDGTYAWLKGDAEQLLFSIDLSGIKENIDSNIENLPGGNLDQYKNIEDFFDSQQDLVLNQDDIAWSTIFIKNGPRVYSWYEYFSLGLFPLILILTLILFFLIPGKVASRLIAGGVLVLSSLSLLVQNNQLAISMEEIIQGNVDMAMNESAVELLTFLKIIKPSYLLFEADFLFSLQYQSLIVLLLGGALFGWGIYELNKD